MKRLFTCVMVVAFCTVASQNASAQADLGLKSAGVTLGMVSPQGGNAAFGFGGFADLGTLAPNIRLSTHLDYWGETQDIFYGGQSSVSDIALSLRSTYQFPTASTRIQPFAGAGLGIHFLSAKVDVPTLPGYPPVTVKDSATKLGLDLGGGVTVPFNERTDFRAELWYGIVDNYDQLSAKVGMGWHL